ncbi:phosphatase PAP2 family protein, partial [Nocardioides sp.]|uniref:phosphatase PAP2 family protein n=1 Tax=Nocardioides sp. TaxID=35761 RepID=UPI002B272083
IVFAAIGELPVHDPDSLIPGYIRFPAIVLGAIALDVVPRVLWRARRAPSTLGRHWRDVLRERWPAAHWRYAVGGVTAWYICYAAFRNLKSMAPFINEKSWDDEFARLDRFLWFGNEPATVMHNLFGTGIAAHFFSTVYFVWIALVPISIAIALVFTRSTRAGAWYVTAVAFDWALGAAFYILFPSVGPIYNDEQRGLFADLPQTYNTQLADSMWDDRVAVMADRFEAGTLQTIAAFPSLHVGIMVTICLVVTYIGMARWIRIASWVFLGLTVLATIYLGWHFFVDVIAGAALGSFTVWAAALVTGNRVGLRPQLQRSEDDQENAPFSQATTRP